MEAKITERLIPESYQKTYNKAISGKSRGAGVKAFCSECCGYDRLEVHLCTDKGCPLYPYRPYKKLKVKTPSTICANAKK